MQRLIKLRLPEESSSCAAMRFSVGSLLRNALAAMLLVPLLMTTGFILMIQAFATGQILSALELAVLALPADPEWGGPMLIAMMAGCLGLLLFACLRLAWLFPLLLILLGGCAEIYVLAVTGMGEIGDKWIPTFGLAGIALSTLNLWRRLWLRPGRLAQERAARRHLS